jgi:AcrR family transcriptional regulator
MSLTLVHALSERKEEILEAAKALFSEIGYVSASMRKIAEKLEIEHGSLYSRFKSKEIMLWEIALLCAQAFFDRVEPVAKNDVAPAKRLEHMLEAHLDVIIENQDVSVVFFEEWKHLTGPKLSEFPQLRDRYEQLFVDVLDEGMKKGEIQALPKRFLSHTLLASANWIPRWYKSDGEMSIEEIKATLKKILINGLKNKNE